MPACAKPPTRFMPRSVISWTISSACTSASLKLQQHFGQANEDVRQILISAEKIERRGTRIQEVEFEGEDRPAAEAVVIPAPMQRRLHAGE